MITASIRAAGEAGDGANADETAVLLANAIICSGRG